MPDWRQMNGGFTFIELMVTLAILGVLVMVAVPMAEVAITRNKERELRTALYQIREALDAYKRATEQGRVAIKLGDSGYPKSLDELVDGIDDQRSPGKKKIYFLRRLPADPMSTNAAEKPSDSWAVRSYASSADDPQVGEDVFDVYSKSEKVGLNGIAYKFW